MGSWVQAGRPHSGSTADDEGSISFSRSGFLIAAVLSALAFGSDRAEASGGETKLALDHPLALVDPDGKTVRSTDFPGKWLLVYFGYTHCADQCPTALRAIA